MKNTKFTGYALLIGTLISSVAVKADFQSDMKKGVEQYEASKYEDAAVSFYSAQQNAKPKTKDAAKASYYLGLALAQKKLYHLANSSFLNAYDKNSDFNAQSFEKIVALTDLTADGEVLDKALSANISVKSSAELQDVLLFKSAEISYDKADYAKAAKQLDELLQFNPKHEAGLNLAALAQLRQNKTKEAVAFYDRLIEVYQGNAAEIERLNYVRLNKARAYFQQKDFKSALDVYSSIDQKSSAFLESRTEVAWALLHSGKINQSLGVVQTLHTPFFENYFDPESLFLRAALFNYNCQVEEADAAVAVFKKNYGNLKDVLTNWLRLPESKYLSFTEIDYALEVLRGQGRDAKVVKGLSSDYNGKVPFKVTRSILKDNRMKVRIDLLGSLKTEQKEAMKLFNNERISMRPLIDTYYGQKIGNTENEVSQLYRKLVQAATDDLIYFDDQLTLVNYEIIETKKNLARRKVADKSNLKLFDNSEVVKERKLSRRQYEVGGKRYWPYTGEYWKDESASFNYFGENFCEKE